MCTNCTFCLKKGTKNAKAEKFLKSLNFHEMVLKFCHEVQIPKQAPDYSASLKWLCIGGYVSSTHMYIEGEQWTPTVLWLPTTSRVDGSQITVSSVVSKITFSPRSLRFRQPWWLFCQTFSPSCQIGVGVYACVFKNSNEKLLHAPLFN